LCGGRACPAPFAPGAALPASAPRGRGTGPSPRPPGMIDAYDVLGLGLDASEEEIKKAYKRASLQYHPDKVHSSGSNCKDAGEKFHEIKLAYDILQDTDRRKIYDTFGVDLGEERPEMEVWTIGMGTLLSPVANFAKNTALTRLALWFISFKWVGRILVLCGCGVGGLYAVDFTFRDISIRSRDVAPILVNIGIIDAIVLLYWVWPPLVGLVYWSTPAADVMANATANATATALLEPAPIRPLLADAANMFYLASEIVGVPPLTEYWKIAIVASLVLARLAHGWWWWILGLQVVLMVVLLVALTVAAGIMRLWIENIQTQRSEKLREWRMGMRKMRKAMEDEIADLKRRLQAPGERLGR